MIRLAICDDDKMALDFIKSLLLQKSKEYMMEINTFDNPAVLINSHYVKPYDGIFLDIEMPAISGLQVAEHLRKVKDHVEIIFITNIDEKVYESFKYRPFRFIRKSRLDCELFEAINELYKKITNKNEDKFYINQNAGIFFKRKLSDIIFFESFRNYININMVDGSIQKVKDSLKKLEEELDQENFVRIHSGFLVNMEYIVIINKDKAELPKNILLPISRSHIIDVRKKYQKYLESL